MPETSTAVRIRPLDELDITGIARIDEKISGLYRPEVWETRVMYYTRRDPGASQVAELNGRVIGFMLGDLRAGEFGLDEPSGWIERFGIDPDHRGQDLGRRMFDAIRAHFAAEWRDLAPLAAEGFCELGDGTLRVLPRGRLYLRHLAMVFDEYLRRKQAPAGPRYSQTV